MKKDNIFRYVVPQFTVASGGSAAVVSDAFALRGVITQVLCTVNDNTGNRTVTLTLKDSDDVTIWSLASIAENATTSLRYDVQATTNLPMRIPVTGSLTLTMTPSGDPGASGLTVDVIIYGEN